MEIKLYRIPKLNRQDTILFASNDERDAFFAEAAETIITEAFYPPYYTNAIKITSDTIDLSGDSYDYLSFEYGGVTYYYFIDSIEYISETVWRLHISMDTLMTFGNDILVGGMIERKHIERFSKQGSGYLINRDYIRENLSAGNFIIERNVVYDNVSDLYPDKVRPIVSRERGHNGLICINDTTDGFHADMMGYKGLTVPSANTSGLQDTPAFTQMYTLMLPVLNDNPMSMYQRITVKGKQLKYDEEREKYADPVDYENKYANVGLTLSRLSRETTVFSSFYLPYNLESFSMDASATNITYDDPLMLRYGAAVNDGSLVFFVQTGILVPYFSSVVKSLNWDQAQTSKGVSHGVRKNAALGVKTPTADTLWDSAHEPSVFDENYLQIKFGSQGSYSVLPLFRCESLWYSQCYWYDYQGYQHYALIPAHQAEETELAYVEVNQYGNLCTVPPIESDLLNDAWRNYWAYNKYSMAGALTSTALDLGLAMAGVSMGYGNEMALNQLRYRDEKEIMNARYKLGLDKARDEEAYTASHKIDLREARHGFNERSVKAGGDRDSGYLQGAGGVGGIVSSLVQMGNASATPNTVKSAGTAPSKIGSEEFYAHLITCRVNDFEQVARYYMRFGNLVNKYLDKPTAIADLAHVRTNFDYLKFGDVRVYENGKFIADEQKDDIALRLSNGVRFWHKAENESPRDFLDRMCDYRYDNVEVNP